MSLDNLDRSRWAELQAVLDVALELPADERPAYVNRVCHGNDALRRDVLALLQADGDARGFLSVPVVPPGALTDTQPAAPAASPGTSLPATPPERIGRYLVDGEIGRGGMGVVYRGTDPVRRRSVAIKSLGGRGDPAGFLASVLREAKLLAWLQHPNVAPIHGIEREDGVPYLVMERVEGESLAQRLERGPLSLADTLDLASQVADALGAAHAAGIVHRDVKPANVMITPGGLAKVLDFGVARHVTQPADDAMRVAPGAAREPLTSRWGTPGYMSPEQVLGLPADARADAFAFGCVVFECLSGACPFARDTVVATVSATLRGDVDSSRLPPTTPAPLRVLLASLLRPDPAQRPRDLAAVARELATLRGARGTPAARSLAAPTAWLPETRFELVGRVREREAIEHLLEHSRVVTLTGPPGVGKTRLAIEVARRWDARHPGDLWYVDLSPATDTHGVDVALRGALGTEAGEDPARGLAARLGPRPGLLVLDGGVSVASVPDVVRPLLERCPGLRVLTTGGHRLDLEHEEAFAVPPLAVPDTEVDRSLDAIAGHASVALLVSAARTVRPGFRLGPKQAMAAARIARAVDGLPLALELAGAMLRDATPDEVASRLEQAASHDPERGDRLDTMLALGLAGLLDDERALFADLAVFAGGWTLEAAVAVCGTDGDPFATFDVLTRLVDQSFVVIEHAERLEPRYRYLEPIRRFAAGVHDASGSRDDRRQRHVDYFVSLCERASIDLSRGRTDPQSLATFQAEHANMLEAIRTCERAGDAARALRLAGTLWRFWSIRGLHTLGRQVLSRLLAMPGAESPTRARAQALFGAGALAFYHAEHAEAEARTREALEIYDAVGDRTGYGRALALLGSSANGQGRPVEACERYREAARILRSLDDQWGLTMALNNLGVVEREQEDYRSALVTYEEAAAHARTFGEPEGLAVTQVNLGLVNLRLGNLERARSHLLPALALVRDIGWKRMAASALEVAGELLARLGEPDAAVELYGSAAELRETIGLPMGPWWSAWRERILRELTERVGDAEFPARWASGRGRSMDLALRAAEALLKRGDPDRSE